MILFKFAFKSFVMQACNIIRLEEVNSTNQYLVELLEKGTLAEGTIVVARHQTVGRGVDGSLWESEQGKNLTFSILIQPDYLSVDSQFYLNKAISLSVYDLLKRLTDEEASIKWPNDIYIGNRKVAGILIQNGIRGNKFSYCVAGIGLNVNQEAFLTDAPNPVSLKQITGKEYDLDGLLSELCNSIFSRLEMLKSGMREILDREYLSALFRLNELSGYIYKEEKISARITGVSRYGHLVLEIPGQKIIECDLKEIKFVI
jgi:BirA family transcriptional regulator, biotin operon repressor / biotin---[acetyl-CoA-carboxylase] ligase